MSEPSLAPSIAEAEARLEAFNHYANHTIELYGEDVPAGWVWRFVRDVRTVCDAMLHERAQPLEPDGPVR